MSSPRRLPSLVLGASALLPWLLSLALPLACDAGPDGSPSATPAEERVRRDLVDLVSAATPLPATATAADENDWYIRRKQTLERLRGASHDHGLAALELWRTKQDSDPEVLAALLDVAAHNAPEESKDVLVRLVNEYGPDPLLRRRAAELLGDALPDTAIQVLEPILAGQVSGRTFPPDETLLEAWSRASVSRSHDRVPLLCTIATDLHREMAVRHLATRLLGEVPSARGRAALEQLLVESTGNHLIRRLAAQSLEKTLGPTEFCALARRIVEKESDLDFQIFLQDYLDKHCR